MASYAPYHLPQKDHCRPAMLYFAHKLVMEDGTRRALCILCPRVVGAALLNCNVRHSIVLRVRTVRTTCRV